MIASGSAARDRQTGGGGGPTQVGAPMVGGGDDNRSVGRSARHVVSAPATMAARTLHTDEPRGQHAQPATSRRVTTTVYTATLIHTTYTAHAQPLNNTHAHTFRHPTNNERRKCSPFFITESRTVRSWAESSGAMRSFATITVAITY